MAFERISANRYICLSTDTTVKFSIFYTPMSDGAYVEALV